MYLKKNRLLNSKHQVYFVKIKNKKIKTQEYICIANWLPVHQQLDTWHKCGVQLESN